MTQEEIDKLSPEERVRLEAAEQEALRMLKRRMSEGRWYPRRHMRFAFLVLFLLCLLFFAVLGIGWLLTLFLGR